MKGIAMPCFVVCELKSSVSIGKLALVGPSARREASFWPMANVGLVSPTGNPSIITITILLGI